MMIGQTPRELIPAKPVLVSAGGTAALVFEEAPRSGSVWSLRRLAVVDADDIFTAHVNALMIVGTPYGNPETVAASDVADVGRAIPGAWNWAEQTIELMGGERVVVWISGATPGRKITGTCQLVESLDRRFT